MPRIASRITCSERLVISRLSSSRLSSLNSVISSSRRWPPTSLQVICARMSPTTKSEERTLWRISWSRVSFSLPPSASLQMGMKMPSSYSDRASEEKPRPPMSRAWAQEPKKATSSSPRKIGVITVMSLRWPALRQGSLVIITSPGFRVWAGKTARKLGMATAMLLIWPGVPEGAWAISTPWRSKTPAAQSSDSRTMVEKAVRTRAFICSVAVLIRRFQSTSSVTTSMVVPP